MSLVEVTEPEVERMNRLSIEEEEAVVRALCEGSSMRSAARIASVNRESVGKILLRVGAASASLLDERMRNLTCREIQVDEVWTFCLKKQAHLRAGDDRTVSGDQWVYVALDPESKIIPSHLVGKRRGHNTRAFIDDLASRLGNRVLLSSDAFSHYADAVDESFGAQVDYAQVLKSYEAEPVGPGRYAPPRVASIEKEVVFGNPNMERVSTSHVEVANRTLRTRCRRFTRLCNGFSRKLECLKAAVALYMADYNFCRPHTSIRMVPAVKAGVIPEGMTLRNLVELAR